MFNDSRLVEAAKAALVPPGEFGERNWSGPYHIGVTHMLSISQTRDSDALQRSNFSVISEDMISRFPNDCEIMRSSHWAVGWVEHLVVRVLKSDYKPSMPIDWEFTEAFEAICEWSDALASYPIADESDYSRREHEELVEYIGNESYETEHKIDGLTIEFEYVDNLPEDHAEQIATWLFENRSISTVDEVDYKDIPIAARELGLTQPAIQPLIAEIKACHDLLAQIGVCIGDMERGIADISDLQRITADREMTPEDIL
jgi:hypothetical protein